MFKIIEQKYLLNSIGANIHIFFNIVKKKFIKTNLLLIQKQIFIAANYRFMVSEVVDDGISDIPVFEVIGGPGGVVLVLRAGGEEEQHCHRQVFEESFHGVRFSSSMRVLLSSSRRST